MRNNKKYEESARTHALKNGLVGKASSVVHTLSADNNNGQFWWSTRTHQNVKSLVAEWFYQFTYTRTCANTTPDIQAEGT